RQPVDQRLAGPAADATRGGTRFIEFARDFVDQRIELVAERPPGARVAQSRNDTLEMLWQRLTRRSYDEAFSRAIDRLARLKGSRSTRNPNRAPPIIEHVENIGVAEIDSDRPAPRTLPVVALEIPIDAFEGDLQRNTLPGPAGDEVERRAG